MATLVYRWLEPLGALLLVHGEPAPSEDDWRAYLAEMERVVEKLQIVLVVTDGPGPNATQRGEMETVVGPVRERIRTAVVTTSAIARGIVTAISWFKLNIRAFAPGTYDAAFAWAGVPAVARAGVLQQLAAMKAELVGRNAGQLAEDDLLRGRLPDLRRRLGG